MRDRWDLNERLFAAYYPLVAAKSERAGGARIRAQLLAGAAGRTLEVGAGHGLNLPHYPVAVTELTLSDPSPHMLVQLREAVDADRPGAVTIVEADIQALPFADAAFDTVVCTYVLCSVPDPARALAEIARVLVPGGRLLFIEHVRAREGTVLGRVQDLIEVPHRLAAAGCHPNRRTADTLAASPLEVVDLRHERQPASLPTVRPIVVGSARRPGQSESSTSSGA
jgi:SAM-dependent methyltransferase